MIKKENNVSKKFDCVHRKKLKNNSPFFSALQKYLFVVSSLLFLPVFQNSI